MQVGSAAVQGASTKHPHRRLSVLLAIAAILVIDALVALVMWVTPLAPSSVGTEDAIPKAGAGSENLIYPLPHGKVTPGAVSAGVHDDAGSMLSGAIPTAMHDDAGNVNH
jgi:hypothetical protein